MKYLWVQLAEQVIPPVPSTVPAGMAAAAAAGLSKTGIEDPLLLLQYQQMQLLQNQLMLRQMRTSAIAKLSQSEHWASLSPVEQNQLILQYVIQDSDFPEVPITTNPFVPHLASQAATNPVMQLFTQMQQVIHQHFLLTFLHVVTVLLAINHVFSDNNSVVGRFVIVGRLIVYLMSRYYRQKLNRKLIYRRIRMHPHRHTRPR